MVVKCASKSLGCRLHTIVNGWLGREKHVLKTESNSFSELTSRNTSPATESVVRSLFVYLKLAHTNMCTHDNVRISDIFLSIILEQCSRA